MGAGRKTQTIHVRERFEHAPKANSNPGTPFARNLRKKDLAGAIFGCTRYTMNECIAKLIFGLPEVHFSYIQNIRPGMPLFLFNYSDRKLHGIFEAAGHGRLNINPHGWTENGSGKTQYPAQVRVRIRRKCKSLAEEAFREVLHKNYSYHDSKSHFQFELDHKQMSQLISLFEGSPVETPSPTLSCSTPMQPEKQTMVVTRPGIGPNIDQSYEDEDLKLLKEACCQHLMESECQPDLPCSSRRNWASLFKENFDQDAKSVVGAMKSQMPELNLDENGPVSLSCSNTGSGSPTVTFGWHIGNQITRTYSDEVPVKDEENFVYKLEQMRKELEELKAFSTEQLRKTSELEKKLVAIEKRQANLEQRSEPSVMEEWELTGLDGKNFSVTENQFQDLLVQPLKAGPVSDWTLRIPCNHRNKTDK